MFLPCFLPPGRAVAIAQDEGHGAAALRELQLAAQRGRCRDFPWLVHGETMGFNGIHHIFYGLLYLMGFNGL